MVELPGRVVLGARTGLMELKKSAPIMLRTLGLDERWLQEKISLDPSLLGLGELEIAGKEYTQPHGGRIDFLMRNAEAENILRSRDHARDSGREPHHSHYRILGS